MWNCYEKTNLPQSAQGVFGSVAVFESWISQKLNLFIPPPKVLYDLNVISFLYINKKGGMKQHKGI